MFSQEHTIEKETGIFKISDVPLDVMDQFITCLYTGKFNGKRKECDGEPSWVDMIPQLVYFADKVSNLINK